MLTADGCRARRGRLLDRLKPKEPLVLADPLNLRYFANFQVDPFSLGADFGGVLVVRPDGHASLFHDDKLPRTIQAEHADDRFPVRWYDGKAPARGPRRMAVRAAVERFGGRAHDSVGDPLAPALWEAVTELRRAKDSDELMVLAAAMRAGEAGHAWARANVKEGMTELDVYLGVAAACQQQAGRAAVVYGDFAVSPGPGRVGGPPTGQRLRPGDLLILDFSVVVDGYRGDFTNTLSVGGCPDTGQARLFDLCTQAVGAGTRRLFAGVPCREVYAAVSDTFAAAGLGDAFPHHAGHGLGLSHPEPPFLVKGGTETLAVGDVVTLEPGLYVNGVGGVRVEHNYRITDTGFERLSNHVLSLT